MNQQPLAAQLRPTQLEHYLGQRHLLAPGKPLRDALDRGQLHSMILWGPPGTGKTTLARLVSTLCDAHFLTLSAVLSGVADIRRAIEEAKSTQASDVPTILFVDEVHRFNKAQQDAFLPFVEDGTVTFIGATTENPSFELNNALLSRCRVYQLRSLSDEDLTAIIRQAADMRDLRCSEAVALSIAAAADGDARRALNLLEILAAGAADSDAGEITAAMVEESLSDQPRRFDHGGDVFYEQISALHKSVRGSAPDAALYWLTRMLDGGCDPHYVARRLVRMASEDIGNADPRALRMTLDAWEVQQRLGSPEGELALAQAVVYLAVAPKSNAVYSAFNAVRETVKSGGSLEVPMHLRNAPTKMMKQQGYGDNYRYAHDEPGAYAAGIDYLPPELKDRRWYQPVERGLEIKIAAKLRSLAEQDAAAGGKV